MPGPENGAATALIFPLQPLRGRQDPVQLSSVQISLRSILTGCPASPCPLPHSNSFLVLPTHAPARPMFSPPLPSCHLPPALAFQPDLGLAKTTARSHLKATEGYGIDSNSRSPT